METTDAAPITHEETHYCAVHPDRDTELQCNKCGRYMCVGCAVRTPVGYRCRECVRGLEDRFYTGTSADLAIVFGVCAVLSGVAGFVVARIGFFLLVLLLAAPIGGAIAEAALRATGRRRTRGSARAAAAGAALGGLAPILLLLVMTGRFVPDIAALLYAALAAATVYARFQMRI
jgi:hypothetical protein